jgi:hypothetical protein
MSLCNCPERAMCEYTGGPCERAADWSVFTPPGRWIKTFPHGRLHFMCTPCKVYYLEQLPKPLKGIDRPEGVAPEDWKPSIMEHLRLSMIDAQINEMAERNRTGKAQESVDRNNLWHPGDERYTPAQLQQLYILRRHLRDERRAS